MSTSFSDGMVAALLNARAENATTESTPNEDLPDEDLRGPRELARDYGRGAKIAGYVSR